jgi:FlaA1/EpsC-like NDP-sugar epimerase
MIQAILDQLLLLPRPVKRTVALAVDVCLVIGTVALSYWVRLDEWIRPVGNQWLSYILAIAFSLPLFVKLGLYRAIFRHAGFAMMVTITYACALYALLYGTIITLVGIAGVPRTIGVLQPLLLVLAITASRVSIRALRDWRPVNRRVGRARKPVIVYGAGAAGRQLVNAAATSPDLTVVAFVDDDKTLQGGVLNGLSIHAPDELQSLVAVHGIEEILLAVPGWNRQQRQQVTSQILGQVAGHHVTIRTLPSLLDLAHGHVTVSDLREIDIDDLLGRDAVPPNQLLLGRNIRGKCVLVTGAGGSIGRELCVQILAQQPTCLVLVDVSEFNLYAIHRELTGSVSDGEAKVDIVPLLASVQNAKHVDAIVAQWRPDTIYHAAAYKHVPLVESNVAEGIANNVLGTLNIALAAQRHEVPNFVLISTDKAVRPTNCMGATKRLAEQILQALAAGDTKTCFAMVRFGNVLGSSGSVVPLFRQQIQAGGPVTVTHPKVTRYFMTIPEAAQLVIQAGAMATGGDVFVLDMGEPVKIADLARMMVKLSGLTVRDAENPSGDIEIRMIGMRPGEKLYEELLIGDDPQPTKHPRIMRANEPFLTWQRLQAELTRLADAIEREGTDDLLTTLRILVPGYQREISPSDLAEQDLAS